MRTPAATDPAARAVLGWAAVGLSTLLACFWALWGAIENFHEGWYFGSALPNLGLMFAQYLSPAILFVALGLVSLRFVRVGSALHLLLAVAVVAYVRTRAATEWIALPLVLMSVAYWVGRVPRGRLPMVLVAGLPLLVALGAGAGPAVRVASRIDDGRRDSRIIQGNGIALTWAPEGPGWPASGASWAEAMRWCAALSDDGGRENPGLPSNTRWRLPVVDEVVRSMPHHGENAGGTWDASAARASYRELPNKETPLWNPRSQVIYWWTATEVDSARALSIAYDGNVRPRLKRVGYGYLGFRCVRAE